MARRKKYIKGKVYITNDKVLVGGRGKKRRVVSMGNDKENMAVRRISSLYDKDGKRKMKTIKRLLWVLLGIVVLTVIGYFIYTGCQL